MRAGARYGFSTREQLLFVRPILGRTTLMIVFRLVRRTCIFEPVRASKAPPCNLGPLRYTPLRQWAPPSGSVPLRYVFPGCKGVPYLKKICTTLTSSNPPKKKFPKAQCLGVTGRLRKKFWLGGTTLWLDRLDRLEQNIE